MEIEKILEFWNWTIWNNSMMEQRITTKVLEPLIFIAQEQLAMR